MTSRGRARSGMPGEGAPRGLARLLAALREGIEGIREHVDETGDPPDYGEDLRAIGTALDAVSGRLDAVKELPMLRRSPEDYAKLIDKAADKAAVEPGKEVAEAVTALKDAVAALDRTIKFQEHFDFFGKAALYTIGAMTLIVISALVIQAALSG